MRGQSGWARALACGLGFFAIVSTARAEAPISYAGIQTLVMNQGLRDLPALLAALPAEYRQNFELIKTGHGLQAASAEFPRVILFGRTAATVLAFNGAPTQAGYDTLEGYEFNPASKRFEFFEIDFKDPAGPRFSETNPAVCLTCHGANPRPILGHSAFEWDQAFGATGDEVWDFERPAFMKFMTSRAGNARYRVLEPPAGPAVSPYNDGKCGSQCEARFRPNLRLSLFLGARNAERVAAGVLASDFYHRFPYSSLMYLLGCRISVDYYQFSGKFLEAKFAETFPPAEFPLLARQVAPLYNGGREMFEIEKLLTGPGLIWSPTLRGYDDFWPWADGIGDGHDALTRLVLRDSAIHDPEVAKFYRSRSLAEAVSPTVWATLKVGGIGEDLARLVASIDTDLAHQACPYIFGRAKTEFMPQ